jgi:hypothetical protein
MAKDSLEQASTYGCEMEWSGACTRMLKEDGVQHKSQMSYR